jgi:hypothetical protein
MSHAKSNGDYRATENLALLKNILTLWERHEYKSAYMNIEMLKRIIQYRIEWTESTIEAMQQKLQELRAQLESLKPIEEMGAEYDLVASIGESIGTSLGFAEYAGKSQEEAAIDVLSRADRPLSPKEIALIMKAGGYPFRTEDPLNSVYVLLSRMTKRGKTASVKTDTGVCFKRIERTKQTQ